ncbi:MAG: hypothetical protein PVI06_15055, partial [Desulfobacterales bacterium]
SKGFQTVATLFNVYSGTRHQHLLDEKRSFPQHWPINGRGASAPGFTLTAAGRPRPEIPEIL